MIKKFIEENLDNMKADLATLVSYDTKFADDAKPFGRNNQLALDEALKMMEKVGLKTKNLDYYCGFGEVGDGDKTIGIVAHLDVVPCSSDWTMDPFKMCEKDGFLYGRGVSDDKGAAIASLYAIKYLIDTKYEFKKKLRLILGCNEETGSRCIKHYVECEGHVDMGFTPDGDFPGIYAEKGIIGGVIQGKSKIINIKGGEASNIVCKKVECELPDNSFDLNKFDSFMKENNIKYDFNNNLLTVYGTPAHASTPDLGVNAINYLFEGLYVAGFADEYVKNMHDYIGLDLHGEKMGFEALKDDITNTSVNLGVISKENDEIKTTLDMRFPVKTTMAKCLELLNKNPMFKGGRGEEPLYFDIESKMIKALKKAYVDVTGDSEHEMEAIGGGTYAKSINNIIAFGCEFIGEDNRIHGDDERLSIESFKKQVEIYVEAIKNLNEV